ncbi:VOC family protein [Paenibacillus hamazuiensis]|uniref:VOC family protein n=1 Tax=Paenibacillus hamazuiensis TaxID=2936508 RepID=UPI00200F33F2|nr:VOC family protein [Paenibacillus hamazuiensis]
MSEFMAAASGEFRRLGLPVRTSKPGLTMFDFEGSYLMIEHNGVASATAKSRAQNPTVIRLNVYDFEESVREMTERGVEVSVRRFDWGGTIGAITDPEGNRIEIKQAS